MQETTEPTGRTPAGEVVRDVLKGIARAGARKMLAQALADEVTACIAAAREERAERGRRLVVRNGHAQEHEIQTGVGPVAVLAPRVRDGRKYETGEPVRFTSEILPPYLCETRSVGELLPWLYRQGVSTNGFQDALPSIFGPDAPGLSSRTMVRLKEVWEEEYAAWTWRPLGTKRYVYIWIDGVHVNVRLTGERSCILVVIGATQDGEKERVRVVRHARQRLGVV